MTIPGFNTVLPLIMLLSAIANLCFLVHWWRRIRRVLVLQHLLERICVDAFMNSRVPFWNAWADAHRKEIMVRVTAIDTDPRHEG
jgi:hypothetical protein